MGIVCENVKHTWLNSREFSTKNSCAPRPPSVQQSVPQSENVLGTTGLGKHLLKVAAYHTTFGNALNARKGAIFFFLHCKHSQIPVPRICIKMYPSGVITATKQRSALQGGLPNFTKNSSDSSCNMEEKEKWNTI